MYTISDTDPIILEGESQFVCSIGEDGTPQLKLYAYDSDEMLSASISPIEKAPEMSGVVEMFKQKHQKNMTVDYGDVFDGKEFLDDVESGAIMDYDGFVGLVIVDGYSSNLGLCVPGSFNQGRFAVDGKMFAQICEDHDVKVVWHNR